MSDERTLVERLRSQAKRSTYIEWGHEAADALDAREATIAGLRDVINRCIATFEKYEDFQLAAKMCKVALSSNFNGNAPDEEHIDPHGECRLQTALATARREALEEAAKVADDHGKKPPAKLKPRMMSAGDFDSMRASVRDEERGERIASEMIAKRIRALLSQSVEDGKQ